MKVELTRFRVLPGKSSEVDDWMVFLNNHLPEALLTLDQEKMYVETIFREVLDGVEYLYWYSIQGEGGIEVSDSQHDVDKVHLAYWDSCIDPAYPGVDLSPQVVMIPDAVRASFDK